MDYLIIAIIAGIFCACYGVVLSFKGIAKGLEQYNSWSLREHPIEKLLRRTIGLMANEPDEFTAGYNGVLEIRSNRHQIHATRSSLKIRGERLPLNDYQEARLKRAADKLYDLKGGTAKQFEPLWRQVSGLDKIINGYFRKRA